MKESDGAVYPHGMDGNFEENKKAYKSSGLASNNKSPSAFVSVLIVWY